MYVCMYVCMYIYIYIYIERESVTCYVYIYIYIYIYTHVGLLYWRVLVEVTVELAPKQVTSPIKVELHVIYIYIYIERERDVYTCIFPCAKSVYPNAFSRQHAKPKVIIQDVAE